MLEQKAGDVNCEFRGAPEIGVIFQDPHFLSWRTVEDNVSAPLAKEGLGSEELHKLVAVALHRTALEGSAKRFPDELSGGMRARAALARALVTNPSLIIADEPFGSVDAFLRRKFYDLLVSYVEKGPCGVLLVTHDIVSAMDFADRCVLIPITKGATTQTFDLNGLLGDRVLRKRNVEFSSLQSKLFDLLDES